MADVPLRPLEVFAVDANMNRASGTIPYTSLTWSRRYHECGQFSMVVPADVYDPSWAYIYADARPETGIVQKVEYSDTSHTPDGVDTVTVSGFFLECFLNRLTFLVEQPEEQTIEIKIPPPKTPGIMRKDMPTVYRDPDSGEYIYQNAEGDLVTQNGVQVDGSSDWEEVSTTFRGMTEVNGTWGALPTDMMSSNFNYKTEDGKITVTSWFGKSETFDIVMEDDKGNIYYKTPGYDGEGGNAICIANACATLNANKSYSAAKRAWDAAGGVRYETITVKGPWQRTDTMEPITESDSVDQLFKWLQTFFGSTFKYQEPEFEGVTKTLDPSLQRMGDFAYSVLQEVGASLRVVYGFVNDTMVLEAYKGKDRTQAGNMPDVAALAQPVPLPALRASSYPLPWGYTQLEYAESHATTGTNGQHIDTGIKSGSDVSITADFQFTDVSNHTHCAVFGGRGPASNYAGRLVFQYYNKGWRFDYNNANHPLSDSTYLKRHTLTLSGGKVTLDGSKTISGSGTFSGSYNINIFASNTGGSASECSNLRLFSFHIQKGATVRDLVPARRESDGTVGMYDTVAGEFLTPSGGSLIAGPDIARPSAQLTYMPNSAHATGTTGPTQGQVGETVTVAENGFSNTEQTFTGWNTTAAGDGASYQPGGQYALTGSGDVLYAQWADNPEPPEPVGGNPWTVFSDTWGTIYDYTASRDTSNYRNTCYVLYSYDQPKSFDSDGTPHLTEVYDSNETGHPSGWKVEYETKRGYQTASVKESTDEPDMECYLDLRDSGGVPACDSEWSRDEYRYDETQPNNGKPTLSAMKAQYDEWPDALTAKGVAELEQSYGVVTNLDTGTVVTSGYMADWDLGDVVEFGVSTVGLVSQARIIGVDEVYESGRADIRIEVGDQLLTDLKKAKLN